MSTFKNIEKLGLTVCRFMEGYAVPACDLEALLQSAQVVYTRSTQDGLFLNWFHKRANHDTHSALLIGITPIKKKTKAALELLSKITNDGFHLPNNADIVQQAKRILEMKDEE